MTDTPTPASAPTAVVSNPLTWLVDFIGSANAQKAIGYIGGPVLAVDFKTWAAKLAAVGAGGVFALGIHFMDWLRTK
jgi:hypothetical protein